MLPLGCRCLTEATYTQSATTNAKHRYITGSTTWRKCLLLSNTTRRSKNPAQRNIGQRIISLTKLRIIRLQRTIAAPLRHHNKELLFAHHASHMRCGANYKLSFHVGKPSGPPLCAWSNDALHALLPVHLHQTKPRPPAVGPFKVVEQAPVEVTLQVDAFA